MRVNLSGTWKVLQVLSSSLAVWVGHQNWLRLGLRRRLVSFLASPNRFESTIFETEYRGGHYRGDLAETQGWLTYFFGGYELKELALADDILRRLPSPIVLDIGGNIGGHALAFAQYAAEVHVFEPFEPLADRIAEQLALNGYRHVHLHRVGLADHPGIHDYFLDTTSRNLGTGSFLADHSAGSKAAELKLVRGDDWLGGKVERVDFIKIDIEGYEAPALIGLRGILERDRPFIVMEVTESSARLFAEHGGHEAVIPFSFRMWRIVNPPCVFGVVQKGKYRLRPIATIVAEKVSYNILIVPEEREELAPLLAAVEER